MPPSSSSGATRLDGLLALLDNGANASVRRMAAKQIGELVATHPSETRPVLRKVRNFLRSSKWETRVAAGYAIAAIAEQSPRFAAKHQFPPANASNPNNNANASTSPKPEQVVKQDPSNSTADVDMKVEPKMEVVLENDQGNVVMGEEKNNVEIKSELISATTVPSSDYPPPGLTFSKLDVMRIMQSGTLLFGSTGVEYVSIDGDVAAQRARLRKDLGIDDRFSTGGGDMLGLKDEDLSSAKSAAKLEADSPSTSKSAGEMIDAMAGLSARERNRLKREAKKRAKQGSSSAGGTMRPLKRMRSNGNGNGEEFSLRAIADEAAADGDDEVEEGFGLDFWDFQPTCEALKRDLLDPRWEMRHGAAVGMREVLKRHAESAGRLSLTFGNNENSVWLEDLCCRLVCVLAMDRFGDFVGDAVVAPVRETAAMIMGACTAAMSTAEVLRLLSTVLRLLEVKDSKNWEVRHASLLGLRYIIAVRQDMSNELLGSAIEPILEGLQDQDDDVRAAAGEALIPVAQAVVDIMPSKVPKLVSILWDALLDLDDISASTSSVLRLLSRVTSIPASDGFHKLWLDPSIISDEMSDFGDAMDIFPDDNENAGQTKSLPLGKDAFCETLVDLVPRLWPFLRHSSKSVRIACINLFQTLVNSSSDNDLALWLAPICGEALRRLFRNIMLESDEQTLEISKVVWQRMIKVLASHSPESCNLLVENAKTALPFWLKAASHETRAEAAAFDQAQGKAVAKSARRRRKEAAARRAAKARAARRSMGGLIPQETDGDDTVTSEGPYDAALMQLNVAEALGLLAVAWPNSDAFLKNALLDNLKSPYSVTRRVSSVVCRGWARSQPEKALLPSEVVALLTKEIERKGQCPIAELDIFAGPLFSDTTAYLNAVAASPVNQVPNFETIRSACVQGTQYVSVKDKSNSAILARTLQPQIAGMISGEAWMSWEKYARAARVPKRTFEMVNSIRMRMLSSLGFIATREDTYDTSLTASATAAMVAANGIALPQKVSAFIKALMASIRFSQNHFIQNTSASALAELALRLADRGAQKPLALVVKNLTKYLTAADIPEAEKKEKTLVAKELDLVSLGKRGASSALQAFCDKFGATVFERMPWLWDNIVNGLANHTNGNNNNSNNNQPRDENAICKSLMVLQCIVGKLDKSLHEKVATLIPSVIFCAASPSKANTKLASKCLADCVSAMPGRGMQSVIHDLLPLLSGSQSDKEGDLLVRQGAALSLRAVVDRLGTTLIPYAAFLIVPMMKRMVDEDTVVRSAAAGVFGVLVGLIPLEGGAPDDPEMSASMSAERLEARKFLGQLLGSEPRVHYELPVKIGDGITLRKYQQECLDWLAFLNKYGLHGALCDDMGLGKTLMTLCIIAGDFATMQKDDGNNTLPSLVACPSTIVAHWVQEATRFFGHALPNIVQYSGPPRVRARARDSADFRTASLVVTSYDILSNDIAHFEKIKWNYVALDEGHVIKNPKTKVAKAVRTLSTQHRLILTGTPIQNSVVELWSMFDFLMPGFLGSEAQFKERYAKPILASRDAKCTEADQHRGMVATEALHRQVLPFVLRRLKDDVLSELPPKIIQDYFCQMTKLQVDLYEDFSEGALNEGGIGGGEGDAPKKKTHIFQALSYLRRLCSHPKLVLKEKHPEYARITNELKATGRSIDDIESSAKLVGLRNILEECGIGASSGSQSFANHRVLIFAQLREMLDIVETDLFKKHMPAVTYMRLDGGVAAPDRQPIVTRFNADPTIDVLLLTTHVGGLGLNLTGADTVIFLEHDWNPTKDLQAMDRAHRMGQKRTVNVYRLITRGTLEEKIMNIQKFKTHIANTVVNRDNSSLQSMNTEQLVGLFKVDDDDGLDDEERKKKKKKAQTAQGKGMNAALAGLDELWEEKQYEDEFNVDGFLKDMKQKE